jgi:predicted metal-dependent peptidase
LVDELINPRVPWQTFLDRWVNEELRDDYDMLRPDRRFVHCGIYLPDLYNEGCEVAVGLDTSGSIDKEELAFEVSEASGILRSRNVTRMRLLVCDADVTLDVTLNPWDRLPKDFPGGGGTSFVPVFEALQDKRPACLIYFTDTFGDFPDEAPDFPVLWVTRQADVTVPFGKLIQIDRDTGGVVDVRDAACVSK